MRAKLLVLALAGVAGCASPPAAPCEVLYEVPGAAPACYEPRPKPFAEPDELSRVEREVQSLAIQRRARP
jgi:hypothetical protein